MSENPVRVCAVVTEKKVVAARAAIDRAASLADMIEVRLDYLRDFDFADPVGLRALLEDRQLPAIITCRATSEGGVQPVDDQVRLRLLVEGARRFAAYCDIEASYYEQAAPFSPDVSRLIVSHHNFDETPEDLNGIYERITALPAAVHKVVTQAQRLSDSLAIFKLLDRARTEGRAFIAMAMGENGLITRVLGPAFGSFLTYGALGHGKESAPGQPSCDELINTYRVHRISRGTSITGIIGTPVAHSASPAIHNRAFADLELDFVYLPFEVHDVAEFFKRFVRPATRELDWNLRGLSVTIPHKTAVIPLLDEVSRDATVVGAVNTIVLEQGRLIGYNTDVQGAMEPLEKTCALEGESIGVIGGGGAARAVIHGLQERGGCVSVFARNVEKAIKVFASFGVVVLPIESLESSDVRIIINTTPVGMRGHSEGSTPVPPEALQRRSVVYDLVYNPADTRLLIDARTAGCRTVSGVDMLIAQAARQFELWTGKKPPVDAMREAAVSKITE